MSELRLVKITYLDGTEITTNMAADLSDDEILSCFAIGKRINVGHLKDNVQPIIKTEILR